MKQPAQRRAREREREREKRHVKKNLVVTSLRREERRRRGCYWVGLVVGVPAAPSEGVTLRRGFFVLSVSFTCKTQDLHG